MSRSPRVFSPAQASVAEVVECFLEMDAIEVAPHFRFFSQRVRPCAEDLRRISVAGSMRERGGVSEAHSRSSRGLKLLGF